MSEHADELFARGRRAFDLGDFRSMRRLALELYEDGLRRNDNFDMARGENMLGNASMHTGGDAETTERYYRSALGHFRLARDRRGEAIISLNLGSLALNTELDLKRARFQYETCLPIFQEIEDELSVAITLANLAEIHRLEGDYVTAFDFGKRSLAAFTTVGDTPRAGWQMVNIAHYHLLRGEFSEAIQTLRDAYEILSVEPNPERLAMYFETWFFVACDLHAYEVAGRLFGFLEDYRERNNVPRLALQMPWFTPRVEKLQRHFSYEELLELRTAGSTFTLEQAQAATYAIAAPT